MRSLWPLAWVAVLGCSGKATVVRSEPQEAIPAEWTVAEDTSLTGDITTASLQLPTAKDIDGLPGQEAPRLILRCLDGRVAAFIAPGSNNPGFADDTGGIAPDLVPVQLDSAPACE